MYLHVYSFCNTYRGRVGESGEERGEWGKTGMKGGRVGMKGGEWGWKGEMHTQMEILLTKTIGKFGSSYCINHFHSIQLCHLCSICSSFSQALQYLRKVCNHPSLVVTPDHPLYNKVQDHLAQTSTTIRDIRHSAKLQALKYEHLATVVYMFVSCQYNCEFLLSLSWWSNCLLDLLILHAYCQPCLKLFRTV